MHVAVIGGGLAGLSAAWLLGRAHQVTVFERQAQPGFTAASLTVAGPPGRPQRVDVPLRVFYPGYYPTLSRLYRALGVAAEPVSYAASISGADGRLLFRYRNLRWGSRSVAVLAPQDLLPGANAWRIAAGWLRFQRQARAALQQGSLLGQTLGQHLDQQRYPAAFVEQLLLPAIATVCTCSHQQAREFPASVIVDYLGRGLAHQAVHRALHGADDVQRRLLDGVATLHCDARIQAVRRTHDGVVLQMSDGVPLRFDHVVLATQAPQARGLLADADALEAAALDGFHYTPVQVVTHGDAALLPPRRHDWSPVNLWLHPAHDAPESTIWVNAVQPGLRGAPDVFQTVNPLRAPRPASVLGQASFQRPVVDARSEAALARLLALHAQPGRRVWFCGSYAQAGIPLLESAVRSAELVAQRLGAPAM